MQSPLKEWWLLVLHWKPKPAGCGQVSHSTLSQCLRVNFSYLDWETTPESSSSTKPQHHQQSWGQVTHLSRWPSLRTQGQSRGVPLAVLLREHWLSWHKLTSPSNYLGGTDRKILNSFSFPANCSHLLPQFWLDSLFPLSSASTTRLSPPHPSPPSPRTSKVITIMN